MPFELIRNDITKMNTDAIVNAANSSLAPGGGVCGAIFAAAGYDEMEAACRRIGHCDVGEAVITDGFRLPARYVIHTVGPIWQGGGQNEAALLRSCYTSALTLAQRRRCQSITFPLISSGIYGYPKAAALQIAVRTIRDFLADHEMRVCLVVFDRGAVDLGREIYAGLESYIDDHYVDVRAVDRCFQTEAAPYSRQLEEQARMAPPPSAARIPKPRRRSLKELLGNLDESFSRMLLRLIDEKGMTDVEVYKRANIDRKLFSKIRKDGYSPSRQTAVALAISLRLSLDETKDLLGRAGYSLSPSSKFDVIIEYFITEGVYDIYEINEALFAYGQKLLGV